MSSLFQFVKPKTLRAQLLLLQLVLTAMMVVVASAGLWQFEERTRLANEEANDRFRTFMAQMVSTLTRVTAGLGIETGNKDYFDNELLPTLLTLDDEVEDIRIDSIAVYKIPSKEDFEAQNDDALQDDLYRAFVREAVAVPLAVRASCGGVAQTPCGDGSVPGGSSLELDLAKVAGDIVDGWATSVVAGRDPSLLVTFRNQQGDRTSLIKPILHKDIGAEEPMLVGAVYVVVGGTPKAGSQWATRGSIAGLAAFLVIVALALHFVLKRLVVRPVTALVDSTEAITESNDYSRRVDQVEGASKENEVGRLIDRFNTMIARIEARDGELADHRARLEADVEERTQEIRNMNEELHRKNKELMHTAYKAEEASRAKSEFLARMNHELRNPLNAIGLAGQYVQKAAEKSGYEKIEKRAGQILRVSQHLEDVINQILNMASIEAGRHDPVLRKVDIDDLVESVRVVTGPLATKNGNRLDIEISSSLDTMVVDPTLLRQGLINLVGNAAKFTNDGVVRLEVRPATPEEAIRRLGSDTSESGNWIVFVVTDSGIGMDPDELGRVFEPFVQANEGISSKFGGTGLGLAVTRSFCHALGGEVSMDSEKGKGTVATIILPEGGNAHEGSIEAPQKTPQTGSKVLIIDDDKAFHDSLSPELKHAGLQAYHAHTALAGVELCRSVHPSVVILDILMPVEEGWSVLKTIKADPELEGTPVIVVSQDSNLNQDGVQSRGATAFFAKPLGSSRTAELVRTIEGICADRPLGRILVVDDEEIMREALRESLLPLGARIDEAADGIEAIEAIQRARPDLILLDITMPQLDGFETIKLLRESADWRRIPIVVLTSKDLTREEREFVLGNTEGILQKKGVDLDKIMTRIKDVIATKKMDIVDAQN